MRAHHLRSPRLYAAGHDVSGLAAKRATRSEASKGGIPPLARSSCSLDAARCGLAPGQQAPSVSFKSQFTRASNTPGSRRLLPTPEGAGASRRGRGDIGERVTASASSRAISGYKNPSRTNRSLSPSLLEDARCRASTLRSIVRRIAPSATAMTKERHLQGPSRGVRTGTGRCLPRTRWPGPSEQVPT